MDYARLLEELVSNPGYIDGRRRFPRTFTPYDALVLSGTLQSWIDDGCEGRAAAARGRGLVIACGEGCNACCEQAVTVFLPEAIRIAEWLKLEENAAAREAFLAAYPAWRERTGDGFERILDAGDGEAGFEAHLAHWQKKVMCAFNREGSCTIYAVRPAVCRIAHALGTNERCKAECYDGRLPEAMTYPALERLFAEVRRTERAMHHALGGPKNRKQALCTAVYELLTTGRHAATRPDDPR